MKVLNLFGVPGAGKSTAAAYIFSQLKMKGVNCELITEFAKDKVWEGAFETLKNQLYVFGHQYFRLTKVEGQVDVVITDSPLPNSIFYNKSECLTENFNKTVMDVFNHFENINYLINRVKPYNETGRLQSEEESNNLQEPLRNLLIERGIEFTEGPGDISFYDKIIESVYSDVSESQSLKTVKPMSIPKFKVGDKVYGIARTNQCCPICDGKGWFKKDITTPIFLYPIASKKETCTKCAGRGALRYGVIRGEVSRVVSDSDVFGIKTTYYLKETGGTAGFKWQEDMLFKTEEEAMKMAETEETSVSYGARLHL